MEGAEHPPPISTSDCTPSKGGNACAKARVFRVWRCTGVSFNYCESFQELTGDGVPSDAVFDLFLGNDGFIRSLVARNSGRTWSWFATEALEDQGEPYFGYSDDLPY